MVIFIIFILPALYLFERGACLYGISTRCVLFGYYFDTFESFQPYLFTVIEALPEVSKY